MKKSILLITAAIALTSLSQAAGAATLKVVIDNVANNHGEIYAALFKGKADFNSYRALSGERLKARAGVFTLTFNNLKPGDYAVRIFHDENGNGRLDLNRSGIPAEGYAFSNEASTRFGPPTFKAMAVMVKKGSRPTITKTKMVYYVKK